MEPGSQEGLARLEDVDLTLIVNIGDDELVHGLSISPDLDTVIYTLAGVEGPEGWGRLGRHLRRQRRDGPVRPGQSISAR